ncbi:MAG: hypothetical protein KDM63_01885 [Verrucomicrobiae bacterium]|nr:hypothetical protein [Verrucomicrobiae bacterium]
MGSCFPIDSTLSDLRSNPVESKTVAATLFRRVLTREPDESELADLLAFHEAQRQRFVSGELDPSKIGAKNGTTPETAAWIMVARAVLNLDEAVTKG